MTLIIGPLVRRCSLRQSAAIRWPCRPAYAECLVAPARRGREQMRAVDAFLGRPTGRSNRSRARSLPAEAN